MFIVAESTVNAPDICRDETLSSDPTESPIITLPLNSASCITPWSFIESDGIPETSFTENIVPVKLLQNISLHFYYLRFLYKKLVCQNFYINYF